MIISNGSWTLDEALKFIRHIQPIARQNNIHLALAGSIVNSGKSDNDLDIICMGMHNPNIGLTQYNKFFEYLRTLGKFYGKFTDGYLAKNYPPSITREIYALVLPKGLNIDFFIYDRVQEKVTPPLEILTF